jgi:hypothetical protein
MTGVPPGQPGHSNGTASLRLQPTRIVDGHAEDGYTGMVELICPACGDDPSLDYTSVPKAIQQLRGPYGSWDGARAWCDLHVGANTMAVQLLDDDRKSSAPQLWPPDRPARRGRRGGGKLARPQGNGAATLAL